MLELRNIVKSFGDNEILRGISLQVGAGEVVALLGPSGSGKTTMLRIIAGLETVDQGHVILDGQDLATVPVHERRFGMVFQDYALFPHKTVGENVAFGLRMLQWSREKMGNRVEQMLKLVGLTGFADRRVYDLSGGEQQRVALARALAPFPRLLLLDEPLGSLDRALRERLIGELRVILNEVRAESEQVREITALYVTHDQAEAFAIADRVVVINEGCIEQDATPVELYRHPRTPFVAQFIGMDNIFPARLASREPLVVESALGQLQVAAELSLEQPYRSALILVRPDAARLLDASEEAINLVHGQLEEVSFRGRYQQATIAIREGVRLRLEFQAGELLPAVGTNVRVSLDPGALILIEAQEKGPCK